MLKRVTTTSPPYALLDKGASIWGLWDKRGCRRMPWVVPLAATVVYR